MKESVIDDKVRRILRTVIAAGFFDRPQVRKDIPLDDPDNDRSRPWPARANPLCCLKNEKHALPLDRQTIKTIAVLGPNADPAVYCGGGSAFTRVFHATSILEGVRQIAGDTRQGPLQHECGRTPCELAKQADVAVVCVGFDQRPPGLVHDRHAGLTEGEGHDRPFELPAGQTDLIRAVAAANPHTIVVINAGGGVAWAGWLDQVPARAAGVVFRPGKRAGRGRNFVRRRESFRETSRDLRETGRRQSHLSPTTICVKATKRPTPKASLSVTAVTMRRNIEPQFCFGHGLSYTEFKYGKVQVTPEPDPASRPGHRERRGQQHRQGAGDEVVQLYIHPVKSSVPHGAQGTARVRTRQPEAGGEKDRHAYTDRRTTGLL